MAWREQLKTGASFRGVTFSTVEADLRVGRRTMLHEYPQRDVPYTEDLGRRARQVVVEGYVSGDDYLDRRDALIDAIEQPGPGELVHPRYGVLQAAVLDYVSVKESPREGGIAKFSITFVEHGENQFPTTVQDTVSQVDDAAAELQQAAADEFDDAFDVAGPEALAADALDELEEDLDHLVRMARQFTDVQALGDLVRDTVVVSDWLVALIRTPTVLAQSLISLYNRFTLAVRRPLSALAELELEFGRNRRSASAANVAGSTLARRRANSQARADLQRRLSLGEQARTLAVAISSAELTANQARALRDRLLAQVDMELEETDPPAAVVSALSALRLSVTRDVQERAELLRQSSTYTPVAVLPSLLLAHRVYQDANRADELVQRNGVRHPAFVPAAALEVLR